jgi:hypothetical protein
MSKRKNGQSDSSLLSEKRNVSARLRKSIWILGVLLAVVLVTIGVFAKNEWFPSTDRKTTWFNEPLSRNTGSIWNPFAAPVPTPTPQLSREYLYAGSRLLAQVDANAQEAPPADLAVWRPSTGGWWVMGGQWSQQVTQNWGTTSDEPVEGDYDGDGKTDFAVWRKTASSPGAGDQGNWYIVKSSTGTTEQYPFGQLNDIPAQADFDGDGKTDSALYRPSEGKWYIRLNGGASVTIQQFGLSTDAVAPADYS